MQYPTYKPFEQQTDRIKIEAALEKHQLEQKKATQKHQRKLDRLEAKHTKMTEDEYKAAHDELLKKRNAELSKIGGKIQKDVFKLNNPYFQINDYALLDSLDIEQALWHIHNTHPDKTAFLQTGLVPHPMTRGDWYRSRGMKYETYLQNLPQIISMLGNTYLASADFCKLSIYNPITHEKVKGRQKECVQKIHSFILDIDFRERPEYSGLPIEDLIAQMRADGMFDILEPSYFMSTSEGSGMYLVYLLTEPYEIWGLPFHERMQKIERYEAVLRNHLIPAFTRYGADEKCSDITRVFRLPNTYNKRSDTWTYIYDFASIKAQPPKKYPFEELEELAHRLYQPPAQAEPEPTQPEAPPVEAEPVKPAPKAKPREKPPEPETDFSPEPLPPIAAEPKNNLVALAIGRCYDLEKLVLLRKGRLRGHRETLLHIYSSQYKLIAADEADLLSRVSLLNQTFCTPQEPQEVQKACSTKSYRYKDSTIISRLAIKQEEIDHFQYIGHADPTSKNEKNKARGKRKRRNADGILLTSIKRGERDNLIKQLHQQGQSYRQISESLHCSLGTISKVLRQDVA